MHTRRQTILTFGEAMALLVADKSGDLATVNHFNKHLAGADNNVAIGLARLGFPVKWFSRLGQDSFGQFIRHRLQQEGVDCQHVITDPHHNTGIMLKARAHNGADPCVEYFRRGSAASHMSVDDARHLPLNTVAHLHVTGITPALSESCLALTEHLMQEARKHGASISFDPNLRPSLWPSEQQMKDTLNRIAALADWVLPGLSEGKLLTGRSAAKDIARFYRDLGCQAVMIKLGPEGSAYMGSVNNEDTWCEVGGQPVTEVVDTVGAGDAFAVGVISGMLEGLSPENVLRRGNITGAQAIQVIGDMEGLPNRDRLTELEQQPG